MSPMLTPLRRPVVTVAIAVALWPLASCDDPLVPRDIAGTYVLESVDGQELPQIHGTSGWGAIMLMADTLTLSPDGSGVRIRHLGAMSIGDYLIDPRRLDTPMRIDRDLEGRVRLFDDYACIMESACPSDQSYEIRRTRPVLDLESGGGARLRYRFVATYP